MTPKEKATELVRGFEDAIYETIYYNGDGSDAMELSKKCALFSVEEVVKALEITTGHCELRRLDQHEVNNDFEYWQKVKTEIEQL